MLVWLLMPWLVDVATVIGNPPRYGSWMRHRFPHAMQIRLESWRLWDSPGKAPVATVDGVACCLTKADLDVAIAEKKWCVRRAPVAFYSQSSPGRVAAGMCSTTLRHSVDPRSVPRRRTTSPGCRHCC